jgi:hypothetical protein
MSVHTYLAPLVNFECDATSEIPLIDALRIRRLSVLDNEVLSERMRTTRWLGWGSEWKRSLPADWALVTECEWPGRAPGDMVRPQRDLRTALQALRLYRAEPVGFNIVTFYDPKNPDSGGAFAFREFAPTGSLDYWLNAASRPYSIPDSEIEPLGRFTRQLCHLRDSAGEWRSFELAISRLDGMFEQFQEANRIVDTIFVLEAVLLRRTGPPLSRRLALRGAYLLGHSDAERRVYFDQFSAAYRKRSKIVHAEEVVPALPSAADIVELGRKVLRRFVERTMDASHDDLLRRLDELALVQSWSAELLRPGPRVPER